MAEGPRLFSLSRDTRRVGLMGFFGYGNLGDETLQEAMILHLRGRMPGVEILGFSLVPEDTERRHGIQSFPISRTAYGSHGTQRAACVAAWFDAHSNSLLRKAGPWVRRIPIELGLIRDACLNLNRIDALIVSGSGPLNDYWGGGSPMSFPYTLLKWALLSKLSRTKLLFVSVGAGPIRSQLSKVFFRWALSLADYVSFRDSASRRLMSRAGYHRRAPLYPDLAYSLPLEGYRRVQNPSRTPIVGINPMGYYREGCWPEADSPQYRTYLDKIVGLVGWLIDSESANVVFLAGEAHYDQLVIDDVVERLVEARGEDVRSRITRPDLQSSRDLLAAIAGVDFVIGSRFHNLLLAQRLGKPVIALSYQEKIDELMRTTGQERYLLQIGSFQLGEVQERFRRLRSQAEELVEQLAMADIERVEGCLEQYDRLFGRSALASAGAHLPVRIDRSRRQRISEGAAG